MKKVLATGLNGMYETTAYLGSMYCFSRMRKNMNNSHGHSNWIDAIERNFVDDDTLSLTPFPSITSTPPDVLVETSAILCLSAPEITIQVISIAEHYRIPIVVTSMGIKLADNKPCDLLSETNLNILQSMGKEMPVFYCDNYERVIDALEFIAKENREAGFFTVVDPR